MAWGWALAAGGSLLGSYLSAQGSKNAASTQSQAQQYAAQVQEDMFNRIVQQEQPFINTGYGATSMLNNLMGFGPSGYTGYGNAGGSNGSGGGYSIPSSNTPGFSPSQGGSPGFGTAGGTMPGAMTPTGMGTSINAGAGNNFGYGAGDYTGAGIYGPQTINMGGQSTTGAPGTNWGGLAASAAAGFAGSPIGALLGYKMASAGPSDVSFNGQNINTNINKTNLQPTNVTIPKTSLQTPGLIMDPKTGGYIGQAYYSTPVGAQAAFHQAIANGQMISEGQNALINAARGQLHQRRATGGVTGDPVMPSKVRVGEDGPEDLYMAPGAMGYIIPNPKTMEKMKKGHDLPRSGGGGLPGRLLGGFVGNMGGGRLPGRLLGVGNMDGGDIANSLALKRSAMQSAPVGITNSVNSPMPGTGPIRTANMGLNPVQQIPPVQTTPGGPSAGFNLGTQIYDPATGQYTPFNPGNNPTGPSHAGNYGPGPGGGITGLGGDTQGPPSQGMGQQGGQPGFGYLTSTFNPTLSDLTNYPGYQFQLQQGDLAVQNQAATHGSALGGAALKGLAQYNQGLAASNYGNYFNQYQTQQNNIFNRLYQLSQMGQNAAGNLGGFGTSLGTGIAQANAAAGGSIAAGQIGAANAYSGAASSIPLYMLMMNGGGG